MKEATIKSVWGATLQMISDSGLSALASGFTIWGDDMVRKGEHKDETDESNARAIPKNKLSTRK